MTAGRTGRETTPLLRETARRRWRALAQVCSALNPEEAKYVLVGAMALQLWGSTRATRDVDILIEATVSNAERVLRALGEIGFGLAKEWFAEEVAKNDASIIGDVPRVDVLTVAWSVHYPEAALDATVFKVEGVKIPAAWTNTLSHRGGRVACKMPPTSRCSKRSAASAATPREAQRGQRIPR